MAANQRTARRAGTTTSEGVPIKKFQCRFEGCERSFTRSEHLQRHLLNHTAGESTCERCRAHFKRRDLLERHMARHRQKDEEAGGEGNGVLNTRKRMWRDADGNIVTKKPTLGHTNSSPLSQGVPSTVDGDRSSRQGQQAGAPISPPISTINSDQYLLRPTSQESIDATEDPWVFVPVGVDHPQQSYVPTESDPFWSAQSRPQGGIRSLPDDVPYDDVFNPDTASSFNMPFTTMSNYTWLFDLNTAQTQQFQQNPTVNVGNGSFPTANMDNYQINSPSFGVSTYDSSVSMPVPYDSNDTNLSDNMLPTANIPSPSSLNTQQQESHGVTTSHISKPVATFSHPSITESGYSSSSDRILKERSEDQQVTTAPVLSSSPRERPLSMLNGSRHLPDIDEIARSELLDLIDAAKPMTPDGTYITRDHPLLSLSALQTYCDQYFICFNTSYPLMHQATFEASHVPTLLLISVLLLGATYCDKDAHQLAVCIHDVIRPQIFADAGFNARPELWVLQTILLVECFGKSRAGQKQHDMSHLFHGLLINLIRRSDCQTIRPPGVYDVTEDLEDDWKTWAEAEQKKRLAFLCFMWDVQHAVLFCQSLCMSAFELRSTLPCDQAVWEADSAESWQQLRRQQKPPPLFLTILKIYLAPAALPPPKNLNALSRLLLLHGLMSISWDMKRRDQTSLGLVATDPHVGDWKHRLATSYDAWKSDFDSFCKEHSSHLNSSTSTDLKREFACYATAYNAIYHAAHIILNAEFLDLQIYAGARHILGRPVGRPDYARSQRVVKKWVADAPKSAAKSAWHGAHILRDGITNLDDFDAMGLFHYPWCLYLATITCWAFHHARPSSSAVLEDDRGPEDDDEMVWDARAEMEAVVLEMAEAGPEALARGAGKRRTGGLTAVVAKCLSRVRWAVVHDGMMVLRGLVPGRLICQYDSLA
ncbi:hypothetical protein M501DRAFT_996898 [Patellaria atrata CBS 101060]|uniref:C2H2-type domain-containing protein n=1 Tax=Patellaria atrata CBS 101060 TaxID=1346257 RepID=A0A9P4VNY2_9PEZI|nr:hypothetical protein M501DRAFT_996898 [Patellaria atrata CBS 101060]